MILKFHVSAVALLLTITAILSFTVHECFYTTTAPNALSASHDDVASLVYDSVRAAIQNETLGFEKVFVVTPPDHLEHHRDSIALAASVTNLTVEFHFLGQHEKRSALGNANGDQLPFMDESASSNQDRGGLLSHLSVLRRIISENITTALILDDNISWKPHVRDGLLDFAHSPLSALPESTREVHRVRTEDVPPALALQRKQDQQPRHAEQPSKDESPSSHVLAGTTQKYPSASSINDGDATDDGAGVSSMSPYGPNWDVLWFGHCGLLATKWWTVHEGCALAYAVTRDSAARLLNDAQLESASMDTGKAKGQSANGAGDGTEQHSESDQGMEAPSPSQPAQSGEASPVPPASPDDTARSDQPSEPSESSEPSEDDIPPEPPTIFEPLLRHYCAAANAQRLGSCTSVMPPLFRTHDPFQSSKSTIDHVLDMGNEVTRRRAVMLQSKEGHDAGVREGDREV